MLHVIKTGLFDSAQEFHNLKETPEREVKCFELELYTYGRGDTVLDGVSYPHAPGNIVLARPGQRRRSTDLFVCHYIHFQSPDILPYLAAIPSLINVPDQGYYRKQFTEITALYERGELLLLQSRLYGLLAHIQTGAAMLHRAIAGGVHVDEVLCRQAAALMEQRYQEPWPLEKLAMAVNLSPIYFHKMFSAYSGRSPRKYLEDSRLQAAKNMLLTTELTAAEIAARCGFSSYTYFSSTFKKLTGLTPTAYRGRKYIS